jgi:hypothetical protein
MIPKQPALRKQQRRRPPGEDPGGQGSRLVEQPKLYRALSIKPLLLTPRDLKEAKVLLAELA